MHETECLQRYLRNIPRRPNPLPCGYGTSREKVTCVGAIYVLDIRLLEKSIVRRGVRNAQRWIVSGSGQAILKKKNKFSFRVRPKQISS